jgi:ribonuclease HI
VKQDNTAQPRGITGRCVLFTDVSLNPRLRLGVGASLVLPAAFLERSPKDIERSEIAEQVVVRRFAETSSTKLEVQTVVWALDEYRNSPAAFRPEILRVYTDSQCIAGLGRRRARLERTGFLSTRTHRPIRNAALYRMFYELSDELGFEVIKVSGHTRTSSRDTIDHVFSIVDKEARKALKLHLREL